MSVIEEDLRLSLDEQQETPIGGCLLGQWSLTTPTNLAIESDRGLVESMVQDQTPATIVCTAYGSGTTLALASHLCALLAMNESKMSPSVWSNISRYSTSWGWRRDVTPAQSETTDRARYLILLRKLQKGATALASSNVGIRAVSDLAEWLQITQGEAIAVAGLSKRTFYHWRANPTVQPRLRSVEALSRLHAFVEGLLNDFGVKRTRHWMKSGQPSRIERLRHEPQALDEIEDEALELMRKRALEGMTASREQWRQSSRHDADEFAAAEVNVPDPLQKLIVVRRGDDRE